jgi:hypothetical protein
MTTITMSGPDLTSITIGSAHAQIPFGCICSYTWSGFTPGALVRNGAVLRCPADHHQVDGCNSENS